jgi:hypothetical protein
VCAVGWWLVGVGGMFGVWLWWDVDVAG